MSSVKFEKETVRSTGGGKEDFMHNVGEALTKGAGPNGYLAVRTHVLSITMRRSSKLRAKLT